MSAQSLTDLLNDVEGWLPLPDAEFLAEQASKSTGNIVEIGSYRGRSTIALAYGLEQSGGDDTSLYAIEPHAKSVGIHGGQFGPPDREAFFRNLLNAGLVQRVALVNLTSEQAVSAWSQDIGLLFIDGDHSYDAVAKDAWAWVPFLRSGALVIFDDARDPEDGPSRVIQELLDSGDFEPAINTDKLRALRKC